MTNTIRPMTRQDRDEVISILSRTIEFTPEEVTVATELIDSYLDHGHGSGYSIIVTEDEITVMGYACYGPTPMTSGTWDLYWIAVDPDKKGIGIGKQLLSNIEREIKEQRGRLILVETSSKPSYKKTRQFYLGNGYEIVSRIVDFYAPGDDKVIFRKTIVTDQSVEI